MNNDAKLLGISLEDGQNLISLLSPKNPLTEISERNVSKIKALRNIIKSYIDSIPTPEKIQIKKPEDIVRTIYPKLKGLEHEELWAVFLNTANVVIKTEKLSFGGDNYTIIDRVKIIRKALEYLSTNIIIVHNHPSGYPQPGKSDIDQTNNLSKACKILGISLLDHIIISDEYFYSFTDEEIKKITL